MICGIIYVNLSFRGDFMEEKTIVSGKDFLGKIVTVTMDRPLGSKHPKHGFVYEVNYGFIPGTLTGDGEPLDAYVLDEVSRDSYDGFVIAVVLRNDDVENKLVVSDKMEKYTSDEIKRMINFVEKYFESEIIIK